MLSNTRKFVAIGLAITALFHALVLSGAALAHKQDNSASLYQKSALHYQSH